MTEVVEQEGGVSELAYEVDLIGNIRQVLAGLQGYDTMALELLQNADDAGAASIRFDIRNDRLIISHDSSFSSCGLKSSRCAWSATGNPKGGFRPCDFHSVSLMATGGKAREAGQIGRFGIGFVSVYQVTDAPVLRSTGVRLQLDPLTRRNKVEFEESGAGTEVTLPWASGQTPTRQALQTSRTPIDICAKVEAALRRVSAEGLLFLKSLERVEIARSGNVIASVAVKRFPDRVLVTVDGVEHPWLLLKGDATDGARTLMLRFEQLGELRRSPEVVVAFPLDGRKASNGLLYAYLPTGQSSGLPCHINADFFPRQDRRSIDITGESHERHFNALLLETAARTIAASLETLKVEVGAERIWDLFSAAGALESGLPVFRIFWEEIAQTVRSGELAFTTSENWALTRTSVLPPADFPVEHETAAAAIGLSVVHPSLREHRNIMLKLGARPLALAALLDAAEASSALPQSDDVTEAAGDLTEGLWSLAASLIPAGKTPDREALLGRLTSLEFVLDADGDTTSIDAQYRAATTEAAELIRRLAPSVQLISERLRPFAGLFDLIDPITLPTLTSAIGSLLPTSDAALEHLGGLAGVRELFQLLAEFELDPADMPAVCAGLKEAYLLPSGGELLPPSRALWPGGFSDPIGHFRLVDAGGLPPSAERLVREVLGVPVLTFSSYLKDHLNDILADGPTAGQYRALLAEIVRHEVDLTDLDIEALARATLVPTTRGRFVRPAEAYERSAERVVLLGDAGDLWLDEAWLPAEPDRLRSLSLLRRLGLSGQIAPRHLAARLVAIAAAPPDPQAREAVNVVVRAILERFDTLKPNDLTELSVLKTAAWLPTSFNLAPDLSAWKRPADVQRPFGSETFFSQLPFADIAALRGSRNAQAFLTFLGVPAEAPSKAIVDHLLHCSSETITPSENIYTVLQQRLERDGAEIARLIGSQCIYLSHAEKFETADAVFWNAPPLRTRWHKASSYHAQRDSLFRFLGVEDEPQPKHYAALLCALAEELPRGLSGLPHEQMAHDKCMEHLAEAATDPSVDLDDELEALRGAPFLLTQDMTFSSTHQVVWCDLPRLVEPFGEALADVLISPPFDRTAAAVLFRRLDVPALSSVVRLSVAHVEGNRNDEAAATVLRQRASLLVWLAPSAAAAASLAKVLDTLTVQRVASLTQRAEFMNGGSSIFSPTMAVDAFFDAEGRNLYVRADEDSDLDWSALFAHLFAGVFRGQEMIDLPALILSAVVVVGAATERAAERALRQAGFRMPELMDDLGPEEPDEREDPVGPRYDWGMDGGNYDEQGFDDAPLVVNADGPGPEGGEPVRGVQGPESGEAQRSDPAAEGSGGGASTSAATAGSDGDARTASFGSEISDRGSAQPNTATGTVRTQRMLAYVSQRPASPAVASGPSAAYDNPIDEAAMQAALTFERRAGRSPERQGHTNKGFDILSTDPATGERRLIEVKGLENAWTARGVKMTSTQYATAQHHGDAFWLYVVEHARDVKLQLLTPLRNPFEKVDEYWFDHFWRETAEAPTRGTDILVQVGARVRHRHFGDGTVERASQRGAIIDLVIAFPEFRKSLPFSKEIELLND